MAIRKIIPIIMMLSSSFVVNAADNFATAEAATALVGQVVKAIEANKDQTFKEITAKDPKWINSDLYPVVYDTTGKCLSHGQNAAQVGKDLIELVDADGKEFVKERVALAKSKGKFWQDYKFTDPTTKKVMPKSAYCEASKDLIICAGIYKR